MKWLEVGIGRCFGGGKARLDRAEEKVQRVRPQAWVSRLFGQDRDGTRGIVEPVRRGTLDQAIDVIEGTPLTKAKRQPGREAERRRSGWDWCRGAIEMIECRGQVGSPDHEGHAVIGL